MIKDLEKRRRSKARSKSPQKGVDTEVKSPDNLKDKGANKIQTKNEELEQKQKV